MSAPLLTADERDSVAVRKLVDWLTSRSKAFLEALPQYIADNEIDKARAFTGALVAHNETLAAIMAEAEPKVEETEETFRDPAARPTKEKR